MTRRVESLDQRILLSAAAFAAPVPLNVAVPAAMAVADINSDNKPDLVVLSSAGFGGADVSVLLGNNDGTFAQPAVNVLSAGIFPTELAVADFNNDGHPDVVVAGNTPAAFDILLNDGHGNLVAQPTIELGYYYHIASISVADISGDGAPDIVFSVDVQGQPSRIEAMLNNGNGTFQPPTILGGVGAAGSLAVGDLTGDGKIDIVATESNKNDVAVLMGDGHGHFTEFYDSTSLHFAAGYAPSQVLLDDVNGDGKLDAVVRTNGYIRANGQPVGQVAVLLGNGNGTFSAPQFFDQGLITGSIALADITNGGLPDIVSGNIVSINQGNGTFASGEIFSGVRVTSSTVLAADVSGDGKPDILRFFPQPGLGAPYGSQVQLFVNETGSGGGQTFSMPGSTLIVTGTAGPDTITVTSDGADIIATMDGQSDSISYHTFFNYGGTTIEIFAGGGNDSVSVQGTTTDDTMRVGLEVHGGAGLDTIVATSACTLMGGAGNDSILAGTNDLALGGSGNDTMSPHPDTLSEAFAFDTLIGGAGADSISGGFNNLLLGGAGNDTLIAALDTAAGNAGNDSIRGSSHGQLFGGPGADTIIATSGSAPGGNLINGGQGNDSILGNPTDTVISGGGKDTITL